MKIYCEHSALTQELKRRQAAGEIRLIYFPVDPDSRTPHISPTAAPSDIQWRDANVTWQELKDANITWGDLSGSELLPAILEIIGKDNRRDALHVDSAYKSGCLAFVTRDSDILRHRGKLQAIIDIQFFHPDADAKALNTFIDSSRAG